MRVELPILVQQLKPDPSEQGRSQAPVYQVRPLFIHAAQRTGERLDRALHRLGHDLREMLNTEARRLNHRGLSEALMNPPLESREVSATLTFRRKTARGRWLAVAFSVGGQRIGFVTEWPDQWFVVSPGRTLEQCAVDCLTEIGRERERDDLPLPRGLEGKAWITRLAVNITSKQKIEEEEVDLASLFGGSGVSSGIEELHRVGRSLDALYPEGLDRVRQRDAEIEQLDGWLRREDRPSVLLVGPSGVGKTALMHEQVRRRIDALPQGPTGKNTAWLLSPARLISGMSYVGQWEQRLQAILKHAKKQDLVLVIDDVIGLFQAGRTSQSSVTVGHMLKPYIERRDVRVVGEMTPEAFGVLREIDRGFAELFEVLHVREPDHAGARKMLIAQMRHTEDHQRCRFSLDALPTAFDLARRYIHDASFPGKAARFLSHLATRKKGQAIDREDVIASFHDRSGLPRSYVDSTQRLQRDDVTAALRRRVIGQEHAIEAAADVVCIGKARLSSPERPLGSLLFLGPTGVGKTQLAKSLAAYLYGDASRLLRFDMNSFNDAYAASRLVGTFAEPDGQLTAAVRRQPFCVILLDEIEKADPAVHDLLLQVLGEGRLTDALGRTADFTNAIIVLTSNLGVRESTQHMGFQAAETVGQAQASVSSSRRESESRSRQLHYTAAARAFFRPELFNRFDRIVPFDSLTRKQMAEIADILMRDILEREGLNRRRCTLRVAPEATEQIIDRGFDAKFGARAIRRALERELTRPIAAELAAMPANASVLIDVYRGPVSLDVVTTPIRPVQASTWPPLGIRTLPPHELVERAMATLQRIETGYLADRGPVSYVAGQVDPMQLARLALREEISDTRKKAERLARRKSPDAMRSRNVAKPRGRRSPSSRSQGGGASRPPKPSVVWQPAPPDLWTRLLDAEDTQLYVKQLFMEDMGGHTPDGMSGQFIDLIAQVTWLEAVAKGASDMEANRSSTGPSSIEDEQGGDGCPSAIEDETCCLLLRGLTPLHREPINVIGRRMADAFDLPWGIDSTFVSAKDTEVGVIQLSGAGCVALARAEEGTHVYIDGSGTLIPIQAVCIPAKGVDAAVKWVTQREATWGEARIAGRASLAERPFPVAAIHRVTDSRDTVIDLRSGLMSNASTEPWDMIAFTLSQLPVPEEFA